MDRSNQRSNCLSVFITIMTFICQPLLFFVRFLNRLSYLNNTENFFSDDTKYQMQSVLNISNLWFLISILKYYILFELEKCFNKNSTTIAYHNLHSPDKSLFPDINNRLIIEKVNYDSRQLKINHYQMIITLNTEHKIIYDEVLLYVNHYDGQLFFVYDHVGTRKTYIKQ